MEEGEMIHGSARTAMFLVALMGMTAMQTAVMAAVGGGDIKFTPKGAGAVVFKHEYHVKLKGQTCSNCHDKPFQMQNGASAYAMDMATLTKGKFCGICHEGQKAFDIKDANSCVRCHRD
jgi:c(7)-type cytochrome triheme protein